MDYDFIVDGSGTVYMITPQNKAASKALKEMISGESSWLGESLAIEHRYVWDLIQGLKTEGFTFLGT